MPFDPPVTAAKEGAGRGLEAPVHARAGRVSALCDEGVQVRNVVGLLGLVLEGQEWRHACSLKEVAN
jgi:hypothetical protein